MDRAQDGALSCQARGPSCNCGCGSTEPQPGRPPRGEQFGAPKPDADRVPGAIGLLVLHRGGMLEIRDGSVRPLEQDLAATATTPLDFWSDAPTSGDNPLELVHRRSKADSCIVPRRGCRPGPARTRWHSPRAWPVCFSWQASPGGGGGWTAGVTVLYGGHIPSYRKGVGLLAVENLAVAQRQIRGWFRSRGVAGVTTVISVLAALPTVLGGRRTGNTRSWAPSTGGRVHIGCGARVQLRALSSTRSNLLGTSKGT